MIGLNLDVIAFAKLSSEIAWLLNQSSYILKIHFISHIIAVVVVAIYGALHPYEAIVSCCFTYTHTHIPSVCMEELSVSFEWRFYCFDERCFFDVREMLSCILLIAVEWLLTKR